LSYLASYVQKKTGPVARCTTASDDHSGRLSRAWHDQEVTRWHWTVN